MVGSALATLTTAPIDRRERRRVSMPGYALLEDGTTAEILVVDLSYDGCGIEIARELAAGQAIKLSVLRRGAVDAVVQWQQGGRAGLVFKSDEEPEPEHQPRSAERVELAAEVRTRRLGRSNFQVRLFDLSRFGCKVELVERPSLGEHLVIKFDGLEALPGEVCWIEQNCAGVRFANPIHPAVFDLLLERLR